MDKNILVIDDSRQLGNLINGILTRQGFKVTHLLTGQEGVDEGNKEKFSLILLDVYLPDMTGFEVLSAIKKSHLSVLPPVIFLSGSADEETLQKARDANATGFIVKPFAADSFIQKLKDLVPQLFADISHDKETKEEKKFLEELKGEYIAEWLEIMPKVESAFKDGNYDYVSQMAHKLAGSGGTMELPFITQAGRKLSELIHEGQMEKAALLINSINSFFINEAAK